jgi:DNA-binding IclR family transcriptional regulator
VTMKLTEDSASARSRGIVRRMAEVMNAFTIQPHWGVRELAGYLDVPKSGLHRTLQEMAAENLLRADEEGVYSVSAELLRIASGLMQSADLTRAARAHLRQARDITGETSLLVAYDSDRQQIIAIDTVVSSHPVQFSWGALREWTDLHQSASGRGILAFLPLQDQVRYFSTPRFDAQGNPIQLEDMEPVLKSIRECGWATTRGARIAGTTGVCAPIRDGRGQIVGGMVVVWPDRAEQLDVDAIGRVCADVALGTSIDLGWHNADEVRPPSALQGATPAGR